MSLSLAQEAEGSTAKPEKKHQQSLTREGTMSLEVMGTIIKKLDKKAEQVGPSWQFSIEKTRLVIITDIKNNRMRIMTPVARAKDLSQEALVRLLQANFDTALDARYALARGVLWATYIHPLKTLHKRQLIEGIGQTVNIAKTYGSTYSSGLLSFGGGDSQGIIQHELIDKLLKKGQEI